MTSQWAVGMVVWGVVNALVWTLRRGSPVTGFFFGVLFGPLALAYALLTLGMGPNPRAVRRLLEGEPVLPPPYSWQSAAESPSQQDRG